MIHRNSPGRARAPRLTPGADKACELADFVAELGEICFTPHVARKGRGDALSQKRRRKVEDPFGWVKAAGGLPRPSAAASLKVGESGMWRKNATSIPGATGTETGAKPHHENIRSGGARCDARLLVSGPRPNPWHRQASDPVISQGEMASFGTDMIGPDGNRADLSPCWTCGHLPINASRRGMYRRALDRSQQNTEILRARMSFAEFNAKSWRGARGRPALPPRAGDPRRWAGG